MRGVCFGGYSEASPDTHQLIDLSARALARKHWREWGARDEPEARGYWVKACRRRVGVHVARAYARYRIRRQWFVGVPRAVLEEPMQRGLAARGAARSAAGPGFSDDDMRDFWAYQAHVRADAD